MTKLIIHVPHASTYVPDDVWPEFLVGRDQVEYEVIASADLYTDCIAKEAWPEAEIIEASTPVFQILPSLRQAADRTDLPLQQ